MTELVQGTDEWRQIRCGKVTASKVADIVRKTKTGISATRKNYAAMLLTERLTGIPSVTYTSPAMEHGTRYEPDARQAYRFYQGVSVQAIGFIHHPSIDQAGCSPDGLVNGDGMVEIKCPDSAQHLDYLLTKEVPTDYDTQMQFQLACTGRQYCDFVSYDPRMPENLRLFIRRVHRNEKRINELETEVASFLLELAVKLSELTSLYGARAA